MADSFLPMEIIYEILERLPLKSLLRFRCVSKDWYNLIDSSNFIYSHLNRSLETRSNEILITNSDESYVYYPDLNPHHAPSRYCSFELPSGFCPDSCRCLSDGDDGGYPTEVVGYCNGLICLCVSRDINKLIMCNPITGDYRILPLLDDEFGEGEKAGFGLGYDSRSDDYKVVKAFNADFDLDSNSNSDNTVTSSTTTKSQVKVKVIMLNVYSMRANSWETIYVKQNQNPSGIAFVEDAVFVNNALHWPIRSPSGEYSIGTFHLHSQEFGYMPLPKYYDRIFEPFNLTVLGGCLCLQLQGYGQPIMTQQSETWIMKEYGKFESWTELFCTIYSFYAYIKLSDVPLPIAYYSGRDNGDILLIKDFDHADTLLRYHLKEGSIEHVKFPTMPIMSYPFVFAGSLVPIPSCDGWDEDQEHEQSSRRKSRKIEIRQVLKP